MMHKLLVAFLLVQGSGVVGWWGLLLALPSTQGLFLAPGAPASTLLAFGGADLLLYAGGSVVAAYGLARRRAWGWPALCVHTGAAGYASLYGWGLPLVSGSGWLGALLMTPSLVILAAALWYLYREERQCN
jgi:hypothetical protein